MKIKISISALISTILLTSCSGGGGSSAPASTPPPPPPPVSTVPTAILTASSTSVDERQSLILDASGSTDADGDALTFTWSQISGPTIALQDNGTTAEITIPELTSDTTYEFQVSVTDGGNSDTAIIPITGTKIVLSPVTSKIGAPRSTIANLENPHSITSTYEDGFFAIIGITGSGSNSKLSFFNDVLDSNFLGSSFIADNPTDLSQNTTAAQTSIAEGKYGGTITNSQVALGFENEGTIRVFSGAWHYTPALLPLSETSVPNVCALASGDFFGNSHYSDIVAGQRGGGIRILINNAHTGSITRILDDHIVNGDSLRQISNSRTLANSATLLLNAISILIVIR